MKFSKKNVITASLAVTLAAAVVLGGGTYAYLQSNTGDTVNTFNTNKVMVELQETTGQTYNIVPGTSQDKDPTVTVDNTVDAYVYVEVTDNTQELVDYTIADGWTELYGYTGVYYRAVAAGASEKSFSVLAGNKVYYSAELENEDMLDDGALKTGIELTFKAYAVQQYPFADAAAAFEGKDSVIAEDDTTAAEAIEQGEPVVLAKDVSLPSSTLTGAGSADINLNNRELNISGSSYVQVADGESFSLKNGTVKWDNTNTLVSVRAGEGSTISFENVEMDMGGKSILVDYGTEAARIDIIDSEIYSDDNYCISTNASDLTTGKDVIINVINSTLTAAHSSGDSTAILMNVPGTLTIKNSNITAGRQAVIVRTGTAAISNSTLTSTLAADESLWAKYDNTGWGSGNEVPVAVLVVGDRSAAYPWDASCTIGENVKLVFGKQTDRKAIYAAAYDGQKTTVSGVTADMVTVSEENSGDVTVSE